MARKKQEALATVETAMPVNEENTTVNPVDALPEDKQTRSGVGSTEKLFPELYQKEEPRPEQPIKKAEEKKEEISPEPSVPEEFYLEDILEKNKIPLDKLKSRIKVDSKEEVLPFSELIKRVQLKEHIDRAGQDLGKQRRELQEEKNKLKQELAARNFKQNTDYSEPASHNTATPHSDPVIESLMNEISSLKQQVVQLNPVVYETNRQRVSNELKADGFDDFIEYIPKMELFISKVQDTSLQDFYDTDIGAKSLYMQLKSKDLLEERKNVKESPKSQVPIQERPTPPIVKMDSGQQASTLAGTDIDDLNAKYNETYKRWKYSGGSERNELFKQLLVLKGAISKEK